MTVDLNDLATGGGAAIDLDQVGATVEGTLISVGEWRDISSKFGIVVKCPFNMLVDNEERTLWVKRNSRLATVLGKAFKDAGLDRIVPGGTLKVRREADVPTDKGNPMHDFAARYTPAANSAGAELEDF